MSTDQPGGVARYRARGAIVQAVRWTGDNHDDMAGLAGDAWPGEVAPNPPADDLIVDTPQGETRARQGDWVIRGVTGRFFVRSDEVFRAGYEPASDPPQPSDSNDPPPAGLDAEPIVITRDDLLSEWRKTHPGECSCPPGQTDPSCPRHGDVMISREALRAAAHLAAGASWATASPKLGELANCLRAAAEAGER